MNITLTEVKVADLIKDYEDKEEEGVFAYGNLLNVRPAYQREFIYEIKERRAVIDTVLKGFPLNTMYWVRNEDGTFGLLDGQQRTLSICEFADGRFTIKIDGKDMYIQGIRRAYPELYERFMNYTLMVYVCEGSKDEQLAWFTTINIAGKALTEQELRNINYTGAWLTSAKRYFSKNKCPAALIAMEKNNAYVTGECNRQEILETALAWITDSREVKKDPSKICLYMAEHQFDDDASELWDYFNRVIDWAKELFPNYHKEMSRVEWGYLYNDYHENEYDPDELDQEVERLMGDYDVTTKRGIFEYVLGGHEKLLSIRKFDEVTRLAVYAEQKGICPVCGEHFKLNQMEADHIIPHSRGGKTVKSNCQMLCKQCNRDKSSGM